jgi:hypothetical protein
MYAAGTYKMRNCYAVPQWTRLRAQWTRLRLRLTSSLLDESVHFNIEHEHDYCDKKN